MTQTLTQTQPRQDGPIPRHIAIIMDGNGRWASRRGLPRVEGHRKGVERVKECVRAAAEFGIKYLTLFSFSSENWNRPQSEVDALMDLVKRFVRRELAELHENNVRLRMIGTMRGIDPEIVGMIEEARTLTQHNSGLQLTIAFNYGARDEIARAAQNLARDVLEGGIDPSEITPDIFAEYLDTKDLPDPDILIRTSGELRLSNFLLWQSAYAELMFVDEYWPDFTKEILGTIIADYRGRERRFGGLKATCSA